MRDYCSTKVDVLGTMLNACLSSAKADKIILQERHKTFATRAQLHLLILRPFASGKTTDDLGINPKYYFYVNKFSQPSIFGSIDDRGNVVNSLLLNCYGKTLVWDEMHNADDATREAMLPLLEQGKSAKALGRAAIAGFKPILRPSNGSLLNYRVSGGNVLQIDCRFSCLASGVYMQRRSLNDWALLSRFSTFSLLFEPDDFYSVIRGENVQDVQVSHYKGGQTFPNWLKFTKMHQEKAMKLPFVQNLPNEYFGIVTRNCLDLARLASYQDRALDEIINSEAVMDYMPVLLFSQLTNTLTLSKYKILQGLMEGNSQVNIAVVCGVSQEYVSKVRDELVHLGLVT